LDSTRFPFSLFADPERNLGRVKIISWISYLTLIVSLFGDGMLAGTSPALLVLAIIPLLIFLPGLIREDHRSLVLLCFVSLLYFIVVVTNLYEPDRTVFGVFALVAVVSLFITAMMYSRWLRARQRLAIQPSSQEGTEQEAPSSTPNDGE
jgi:uncharacterized membrane protein